MKKILATLIFTASMITAATAQNEKKAISDAISYAENVAFVLAGKEQNENLAYVFLSGNGYPAQKEYTDQVFKFMKTWMPLEKKNVMEPKTHVLRTPRKDSKVESTGVTFDTVTINFEAGKYYTVYSSVEKSVITDFYIRETDITPYLAYQTAHPNRLTGTWNGEAKRLLTSFSNQYSFDGSRMKFAGQSKNPKQTFDVEGRMMYNENTIIFFPESACHKGKEVKNFNKRSDRAVYIWYYTFTDNGLHIEEGNPFFIGTQTWVNIGNFKKMN
jgi:hypothetical protein